MPDDLTNFVEDQGVLPSISDRRGNPKLRVRTTQQARAILYNANRADQLSLINRNVIQAELDGTPPYNPRNLASVGQEYRTNANFRYSSMAYTQIMSAIRDAVESNPSLIQVRTTYGTETQRMHYSQVLSTLLTKMITKDWQGFSSVSSKLHRNWCWFGLGIAFFPDSESWVYDAGGLDIFAFPRETFADESKLEIVFSSRILSAHELFDRIRENRTAAREMGWNPEAVEEVLINFPRSLPNPQRYLEDIERMIKNGDLTVYDQIGTAIPVTTAWVREFDGTITECMFYTNANFSSNENDNSVDESSPAIGDFLYFKKGAYNSMNEAFTLFPYDHGTNGYIHSFRGVGNDILPHTSALNRIMCQTIDCTYQNLALVVSAGSEAGQVEGAINPLGPYVFISPGYELHTGTMINVAQASSPTLEILNQNVSKRIGNIDNMENQPQARTELEAAIRLGNLTRLNASDLDDLFKKYTLLFREVVKRIKNMITNQEAFEGVRGYPEIEIFLRRLQEYEVPLEAVLGIIDSETVAVPALGFGSSDQRKIALKEALSYSNQLTEDARQVLLHEMIRSSLGQTYADRLVPLEKETNTDVKELGIASLQNNAFIEGKEAPVYELEDHEVHLSTHTEVLLDVVSQAKQNPDVLVEVTPVLQAIVPHFSEHLSYLAPKADMIQQYDSWKELLNQSNEFLVNGTRKLQAMQRKQQEEAATQQAPAGQPEEKSQLEVQKIMQSMELERQKTENEIQLKQNESANKIAIQNATLANKELNGE